MPDPSATPPVAAGDRSAHGGAQPRFSARLIGYAACAVLAIVTVVLRYSGASHAVVFVVAAFALIMLAWLIGVATEELGASLGPRLGGVLNATFGNAPELIITFFALRAGLQEVVKASITGSILGNLLLVLGASFIAGGVRHGTQSFSKSVAGINSTLLVIAVIGLFIPAVFNRSLGPGHGVDLRHFSTGVAIILIGIYALSLVFFFSNPQEGEGAIVAEEEANWSVLHAALVLAGAAAATALLSEILVGALEPTINAWGISELFAGIIIIPVIGNIAEHLVGVQLALRDKMEFSIVVSVGSSLQVALFVAPVLILLSHLFATPMDLVFSDLEVVTVGLAVVLVALVALDGESNWFEGVALTGVYAIVALAFYFFRP